MGSRDANAMELQDDGNFENNDGHTHHSHRSSIYDTRYLKSLRHYLTREALPKEGHYRNADSVVHDGTFRPTLDDLHNSTFREIQKHVVENEEPEKVLKGKVIKFGWLEGVLMRCMLNIWGVTLFLRVSWVIGQAGLLCGILIITLSNAVTFITAISMSAVATNGQIKAGGIYYMISRSLGPEFGGSIGLMFILANSIAAGTHIIGFVNGIQEMCQDYFDVYSLFGVGSSLHDVRILGVITLICVLALALVGMDWVTRVQKGLLVLLIAAQVNFVVGSFVGPMTYEEEAKGFVGYTNEVFQKNLYPEYRYFVIDQSFFGVFGVFFPAVTGIVAGANLSGDLKDPGVAIPKGTLLAITTTFVSYIIYSFMLAGTCVRDAFGNDTLYLMYKDNVSSVYDNPSFNEELCPFDEHGQSTCIYGLQNDVKAMEVVACWGPLVYMGCYAATLSSAIASLVGAPRVLQALAKDRLYPFIHFFEVGYGANNDPVRGYCLVFVLSFFCIMLGDLNAVSTILTNFFLAAYCLINISCFHASLIKSPGWRPAFKYYNGWVSLVGAILCLGVMFAIDWITALCTFIVSVVLYIYVSNRNTGVNWGSSTQAQAYLVALKSSQDLMYVEEHVKNYRPQILLLSGNPAHRPSFIDFAYALTKNISILCCGQIVQGRLTYKTRNVMQKQAYTWMRNHKVRGFYSVVAANTFDSGVQSLYQLCGLGKLTPNIVLIGYKSSWQICNRLELKSYFTALHEAFDMCYGVAILRVPEGLDYANVLHFDDDTILQNGINDTSAVSNGTSNQTTNQTTEDDSPSEPATPVETPATERADKAKDKKKQLFTGVGGTELPKDVLNNITRFKHKQKKGLIDVWWLYDDGGLTLLLPHILETRSQWAGCKLRVFALANRKNELDMEQRSMANLLAKFRIDYGDMIVIPDMARKAAEPSRLEFAELIKNFVAKDDEDMEKEENKGYLITEDELDTQKGKTNRHIRLRELLLENSKDSTLVVMTLPMPRKNTVSPTLYMAWLETLTKDMPPFLLVRGNQTPVLTFYS